MGAFLSNLALKLVFIWYCYDDEKLFDLFVPAPRIFICTGRLQYDPKTKCRKGYFQANRPDRCCQRIVPYQPQKTKNTA